MAFALLGLVLDSSAVIAAKRKKQPVMDFIEGYPHRAWFGRSLAAAAIEQSYAVLTGNLRHFQKILSLTVVPL